MHNQSLLQCIHAKQNARCFYDALFIIALIRLIMIYNGAGRNPARITINTALTKTKQNLHFCAQSFINCTERELQIEPGGETWRRNVIIRFLDYACPYMTGG